MLLSMVGFLVTLIIVGGLASLVTITTFGVYPPLKLSFLLGGLGCSS